MKSRKKGILFSVIAAAIILLIVFLIYFFIGGAEIYSRSAQMSTNERTSDAVLEEWLVNDVGFDIDGFRSSHTIEEIEIESSLDGHKIPASYIYADGNKDKTANTVIMVHGLLGNRLSNYTYAEMFLARGYNVITYDQRSSGGNTAPYTTYGYLESYDTLDYVSYAASEMADGNILGVWGQSMGAATVENAMDEDIFKSEVDFVVLDCPLGNMEDIVAGRSFGDKLHIAAASLINKVKVGFFYSQQRVYPQIENTEIPVLVVASESDERVPFRMEKSVYDCIKSEKKRLYSVSDSKHSEIYFDHPDEYAKEIEEFVAEFVS